MRSDAARLRWALTTGRSSAPVVVDGLAWPASEAAWEAVLGIATPTD